MPDRPKKVDKVEVNLKALKCKRKAVLTFKCKSILTAEKFIEALEDYLQDIYTANGSISSELDQH